MKLLKTLILKFVYLILIVDYIIIRRTLFELLWF